METYKNGFTAIRPLIIFLLAFALVNAANAQNLQYRDPANPARGYWEIVTNATSQNTKIQFYDGDKTKIYEEIISGKYIKLTPQNLTRINKTFDQIADKTMILAQVKAEPLTSPAFRKLTSRQSKKISRIREADKSNNKNAVSNLESAAELQVNAYHIEQSARVYLTLHNPNQERLHIYIFNEVGENMYHKTTTSANYTFKLNFVGMNYGQYKLVVYTASWKQKYSKLLDIKPPSQNLRGTYQEPTLEITNELASH